MNLSNISWYMKKTEPMALAIGPAGWKDREWRELEPVATPRDRLCNGFYVDAEMRCLLNRYRVEICYNSAKPEKGKILYSNINLTIPQLEEYLK